MAIVEWAVEEAEEVRLVLLNGDGTDNEGVVLDLELVVALAVVSLFAAVLVRTADGAVGLVIEGSRALIRVVAGALSVDVAEQLWSLGNRCDAQKSLLHLSHFMGV